MLLLHDEGSRRWQLFENPLAVVTARSLPEVVPALASVENQCVEHGRFAAGFLSYEAAPAFDEALRTKAPDDFPLLWFGIFSERREVRLDDLLARVERAATPDDVQWQPSISREHYLEAFARLQELIRSGDTYQVNFTYRLRARMLDPPLPYFLQLALAQRPPFGAYIDTGEWALCSVSPELFFRRSGAAIESRPMKGTAARGLWYGQDVEIAERLRHSQKERAENVMIVDMVRNDLGRVARAGSVRATRLFDVERHPTVWQMTSTVEAETDASLADVMRALFPPASITGAPKARTMEIIADLECSPRRGYTGTIGFVEPGGGAQFNVAIRTMVWHRSTSNVEYGIGGGIVADSEGESEFSESRLKAKALSPAPAAFDLLETFAWTPDGGFALLTHHLRRLRQSAEYFGFVVDFDRVASRLDELAHGLTRSPHRVRMTVSRLGAIGLAASPFEAAEGYPPVTIAAFAIDTDDPFLYHKTTNRDAYERAVASRSGFTDVLLYNSRGEITESTIANIVLEIEGGLVTPPIECGLLPGTARAKMLEDGKVSERRIQIDDLKDSRNTIYLLNSVRGLRRATFVA